LSLPHLLIFIVIVVFLIILDQALVILLDFGDFAVQCLRFCGVLGKRSETHPAPDR